MDIIPKMKVLLLRQTSPPEAMPPIDRLHKALSGFCEVIVEERGGHVNSAELNNALENYSHIFVELPLSDGVDQANTGKITYFVRNSFDWTDSVHKAEVIRQLENSSCLVLGELAATELLRILHLYLLPKRSAGVTALMEKGSLILGEKIQDLDGLGELMDKLYLHLQSQDQQINNRAYGMRQLVTSMLHEAFLRASEVASTYPTVQFQCSANQEKITFNIRFPIGKLPIQNLKSLILGANSVPWYLSWQSSDIFCLIHHEQHNELEVLASVYRGKTNTIPEFKSLLFAKREKSASAENLLVGPKSYSFSTLSGLKKRQAEQEEIRISSLDSLQNEIDESLIPEPVKVKLAQVDREKTFLKEVLNKKEILITELNTKLNAAAKEIVHKRNELVMLSREQSNAAEQLRHKIHELEKKQSHQTHEAPTEKKEAEQQQHKDIIQKHEQRYAALHKEFSAKEREIQDLKTSLLKAQKSVAATSTTTSAPDKENQKKIQEIEGRELVLKQEVRKLNFKLENAEKAIKAAQTEAAEKIKLIEKKYEEVKSRELDLMKKLDTLSGQLKKTNKAA